MTTGRSGTGPIMAAGAGGGTIRGTIHSTADIGPAITAIMATTVIMAAGQITTTITTMTTITVGVGMMAGEAITGTGRLRTGLLTRQVTPTVAGMDRDRAVQSAPEIRHRAFRQEQAPALLTAALQ